MNITEADMGKWFRVPWSPNPYKMVKWEAQHCSLHGEFCWNLAGLIKRRNSETRKWGGCVNMVRADQNDILPWDGPEPSDD